MVARCRSAIDSEQQRARRASRGRQHHEIMPRRTRAALIDLHAMLPRGAASATRNAARRCFDPMLFVALMTQRYTLLLLMARVCAPAEQLSIA